MPKYHTAMPWRCVVENTCTYMRTSHFPDLAPEVGIHTVCMIGSFSGFESIQLEGFTMYSRSSCLHILDEKVWGILDRAVLVCGCRPGWFGPAVPAPLVGSPLGSGVGLAQVGAQRRSQKFFAVVVPCVVRCSCSWRIDITTHFGAQRWPPLRRQHLRLRRGWRCHLRHRATLAL